MSIDIESLSYEELLELQHKISQRLRAINSGKIPKDHTKFNQGDKVSFAHPTLGIQTGTLLTHNDTTVTVVTRSGQQWDVSPHLLRKVVSRGNQSNKVYKIPNRSKE
ncbi:MAG: hypothetical protein KJO28_11075 [Desulfofustis sp.]|nr:hypothetical protein [Desulfofustis sp.]NNF47934.1 hypothetical protein [Desulfofustis sp.]